jgi:hypothetical protein
VNISKRTWGRILLIAMGLLVLVYVIPLGLSVLWSR